MCDQYGWPSVFYAFGAAGLVWFLLWAAFVSSYPSTSRFIGDEEKAAIAHSLRGHVFRQVVFLNL